MNGGYIKSIFSVHFLAAQSNPCCLSSSDHPQSPFCSFFSCMRRRFFSCIIFTLYTCTLCCVSWLEYFYHWRMEALAHTHTIFFLFNFFHIHLKTPSLAFPSHPPPSQSTHLPQPPPFSSFSLQYSKAKVVFTIHSTASLKNCLFYYIFFLYSAGTFLSLVSPLERHRRWWWWKCKSCRNFWYDEF